MEDRTINSKRQAVKSLLVDHFKFGSIKLKFQLVNNTMQVCQYLFHKNDLRS